MNMITKIACRTIGTAGMGLALYDAYRVGQQYSRAGAENQQAKYLEKAYFDSRSIDNTSFVSNNLRKKTFELRSNNPIPAIWGRIKGACKGASEALGANLITVGCSALALISKGFMAKVGAVGVGLS